MQVKQEFNIGSYETFDEVTSKVESSKDTMLDEFSSVSDDIELTLNSDSFQGPVSDVLQDSWFSLKNATNDNISDLTGIQKLAGIKNTYMSGDSSVSRSVSEVQRRVQ